MTDDIRSAATGEGVKPLVVLVNPFEKIPGENFRDQRYTYLFERLGRRDDVEVHWLSADFHHWSHTRRDRRSIPVKDRERITLVSMPAYRSNVSLRRVYSYAFHSAATLIALLRLPRRPAAIVCMGAVEQMFLIAAYGRLRDVPVLIDVIDVWPDLYVRGFPPRWRSLGKALLAPYFLMSACTFRWAAKVSAVSRAYLDWAKRRGRRTDDDAFVCYYLGCRNEKFDDSRMAGVDGPLRCLFAGQFGFSYDIELLVAAARECNRASPGRVEFVVCGAGSKLPLLEEAARSLPNLTLKSWLSPDELNAVAAQCHVGLCCYAADSTQSLPTKLFDYLSMGLPVVSSLPGEAVGFIDDRDLGASYRAGDVHDFLRALDRVRDMYSHEPALRHRVRSVFLDEFDFSAIYDRMIDETIVPLALGPSLSARV